MYKLLVIDDEEAIVRVLAISLRADGYEVVTALSGEEGLTVFEAEAPDIVLTDIKMPGMDGIAVLRRIKSLAPEKEVIIITGHGDIENAIEALQYGASDFINKPVRDEALSIALSRAAEKLDIKAKLKAYTQNLEDEVKRAAHELWRKSNFLSNLIKSSNDAIVATDKNLLIVIFNPAAERLFGWSQAEVVGKKPLAAIYPKELLNFFDKPAPAQEAASEAFEAAVIHRDGTQIPVRFAGTLLHENSEVQGSVSFIQDLREIKRLQNELLRSERMAAIGQTVAGIAHGVKNILHGFKGGSYLVELGLRKNNPEKLQSGWDMVKRNIKRTSDLVLDLLSYSREREPEFAPCRPNDIAADVCDLLAQTAKEHHVRLLREFDPEIGEVRMDAHTIHQALTNLISNAIDACLFDENTRKNFKVSLKTVHEKGIITFRIKDNGAGMSEDVQKKLFHSFFSTKGHRGTGLGLLVTRKAVEEHNGEITVTSTPGKGTCFTIRLPYETGSALRSAANHQPHHPEEDHA